MTPDHQHPADDHAVVITRSAEELRISTRRRATRRARLRKRLETRTEIVQREIPVRRELVEIEYTDLDDDPLPDTERPAAEQRWLVLYEEEIVIETRWVARERVRLAVTEVTEDRVISAPVRAEHITTEPVDGT